jgi:tetratricopeptide (TPR) repeat protein
LVKALSDAGVALMAGTDAPDVGPMAGFGIHDELQEVVNDGLTPYQALQMATINPARYFGKLNEFGSIEIGKRADFILLDGNPLGDISRTRVIAGVMVRGKWIPNKELTSLVEEIPAAYQSELRLVEAKLTSSPAEGEEYLADHDPLRTLGIAAVTELFHSQGLQKFHQFVAEVRRKNTKTRLVSEAGINTFGYVLLNENKFPDAIAILRMNTEDFPASANCFDSLAEALAKSGDIVLARAAYNKALAIDQHYPNAAYALKFLAEHPEK